jgi:AbrB family looped-hinge helix DNA binding protein
MRITSKGQVTIPLDIRNRAGLLPGAEVEFSLRGHTVVLQKARGKGTTRGRGARLLEAMRGRGTVKMTTDQIMALTRGE